MTAKRLRNVSDKGENYRHFSQNPRASLRQDRRFP